MRAASLRGTIRAAARLSLNPVVAVMTYVAALSLSDRNLCPVYAVCGRFLPIPPASDQQLGGVVMWVLGAAGRNLEQEEAELSARRLAGQS